MARDYAKRNNQKQKKKPTRQDGRWRWVALFVAAVLLFGAWYGFKRKEAMKEPLPVVEAVSVVDISDQVTTGKKGSDDSIQYEFYSMLPEIEVEDADPEQSSSVVITEGFWLQLGAFFTEDTARDMQQRMQLLGLDPLISHYQSAKTGRTIYRVEIGPYQSYQDAQSKQQELQQIKVSSMIRNAG